MSISLHKILFGAAPLSLGLLGLALPAELLAADETLGTVVVTGVRGSQQRTVTDSPAPIDVIDLSLIHI